MAPSARQRRLDPRVEALANRFGLPDRAALQLATLLALVLEDPLAPTAITDAGAAIDDHLADSLVALDFAPVREATEVADVGSGAGFPGLPLAIALPRARFALVESAARKCAFLERAVAACGLANVSVVHSRAESWRAGVGRHDLVTARAVGALSVVAEYAAPLLRIGGTLVAWRGRRDTEADGAAVRAADQLGMAAPEIHAAQPYPRAEHRHLYLMSKVMETPAGFPRRPGAARKRPLGTRRSTTI